MILLSSTERSGRSRTSFPNILRFIYHVQVRLYSGTWQLNFSGTSRMYARQFRLFMKTSQSGENFFYDKACLGSFFMNVDNFHDAFGRSIVLHVACRHYIVLRQ